MGIAGKKRLGMVQNNMDEIVGGWNRTNWTNLEPTGMSFQGQGKMEISDGRTMLQWAFKGLCQVLDVIIIIYF